MCFVTVGGGSRLHPTVDERTAAEAPLSGRQAKAATLDIEDGFTGLPYDAVGKEPARDLGQDDFLRWAESTESASVGNRGEVTTVRLACGACPGTTGHNANEHLRHRPESGGEHYPTGLLPLASSSLVSFFSTVRFVGSRPSSKGPRYSQTRLRALGRLVHVWQRDFISEL